MRMFNWPKSSVSWPCRIVCAERSVQQRDRLEKVARNSRFIYTPHSNPATTGQAGQPAAKYSRVNTPADPLNFGLLWTLFLSLSYQTLNDFRGARLPKRWNGRPVCSPAGYLIMNDTGPILNEHFIKFASKSSSAQYRPACLTTGRVRPGPATNSYFWVIEFLWSNAIDNYGSFWGQGSNCVKDSYLYTLVVCTLVLESRDRG